MKLLNCQSCNDIVALHTQMRECLCGKSSGRYQPDGLKAVYQGPARILGMRNSQYSYAVPGQDYVWFVIPEGHNIRKTDSKD